MDWTSGTNLLFAKTAKTKKNLEQVIIQIFNYICALYEYDKGPPYSHENGPYNGPNQFTYCIKKQ